jgi:hypothetical protein
MRHHTTMSFTRPAAIGAFSGVSWVSSLPWQSGSIIWRTAKPHRSRTSHCLREVTTLYAVLHTAVLHLGKEARNTRTSNTQWICMLTYRHLTNVITVHLALRFWLSSHTMLEATRQLDRVRDIIILTRYR